MLRIPFELFEFACKCFESHSNASHPFRMVRIYIAGMLRIPFEWFEFGFECFESISNGSNLHSSASDPFWMLTICIRMLRISLKFAFELVWMVRISTRMLQIRFECFKSPSNGWICMQMLQISIRKLRIPFKWLEFAFKCFKWLEFTFECFESLLNCLNLDFNASNPFQMVRI